MKFSWTGWPRIIAVPYIIGQLGILLFWSQAVGAAEVPVEVIIDSQKLTVHPEVKRAVEMKKAGLSAQTILNVFDKENVFAKFKRTKLSADDVKALKSVGFEDDFIEKLNLVPSYLTVGPAVVWLKDVNDVVGSALVRIYLPPRSFFERRAELTLFPWSPSVAPKDFWKCKEECWILNPLSLVDRLDLNFGVTTNAKAEEKGEKTAYFLLGGSYEFNRFALLNYGLAFSTEGDFKESSQFYLGFTVDSNILKELGFMSK